MTIRRASLLLPALALTGCASYSPYSGHAPRGSASCPDGTMMICQADTLHGGGCGRLVVL
ncbi:MAG: hypothetical protein R3192_09620 [Woeseiaceae bacterium]|nr:hypothetical protein [Woeseiaceae bacterium]